MNHHQRLERRDETDDVAAMRFRAASGQKGRGDVIIGTAITIRTMTTLATITTRATAPPSTRAGCARLSTPVQLHSVYLMPP